MDISFHRGNDHHRHFFSGASGLQQRFQHLDGILHGFRTGNQLRQKILALIKEFTYPINGRKQYLIQ